MRLRWFRMALAVPLLAALLGVLAPAASAHNSLNKWDGWAYSGQNQCIAGHDEQNHGGQYLSRYVETDSDISAGNGACGGVLQMPVGQIAQQGTVYKTHALGLPGELCTIGPWQFSPTASWRMWWQTNEDMWLIPCNYGAGVNVVITHDLQHAVRDVNNHPYWLIGSGPRPTTYHCHCP